MWRKIKALVPNVRQEAVAKFPEVVPESANQSNVAHFSSIQPPAKSSPFYENHSSQFLGLIKYPSSIFGTRLPFFFSNILVLFKYGRYEPLSPSLPVKVNIG